MSSVREGTCKCGRKIVVNDAEKSVSHEAPECDFFLDLMKQAAPHETRTVTIDEQGRSRPAGKA